MHFFDSFYMKETLYFMPTYYIQNGDCGAERAFKII